MKTLLIGLLLATPGVSYAEGPALTSLRQAATRKDGNWLERKYKESEALYVEDGTDLKDKYVFGPAASCRGFARCLGKAAAAPVTTPLKMAVYNTIDRTVDFKVYPFSRGPFNPNPVLAPFTGLISGALVAVYSVVCCAGKAVGSLVRGDLW